MVTMMITRAIMGSKYPTGSRVVSNSDFLLTANVNLKPRLVLAGGHLHAEQRVHDGFRAGTGSPGPISSVM